MTESSSAPATWPTVAYLGPIASYSHQATKSVFLESEYELQPTDEIKGVFEAVQSGHVAYGVVPYENSSFGSVKFTLDELADRANTYGELNVCGEIYLKVHHFLLGRRRSRPDEAANPTTGSEDGQPLTDLSHIRKVYSHQQALGQTKKFRDAYLAAAAPGEAVSSTSRAAEMVAQDESGTSAAVASELAGEVYGLDVLARCIEDMADNTTWFLVLRRGVPDGEGNGLAGLPKGLVTGPESSPGIGSGGAEEGRMGNKQYRSLVSFTVPHAVPGALAAVLGCFSRYGLNMTNISRLPSLARPFESLFFVEFEGSKLDDPDRKVKSALEDLGKAAQWWRWLGSWVGQRP